MVDTIHNENRLLRRKLENLLRQARTNEKKQGLFDSFGFEIIGSNSPAQLCDYLLVQMQVRFHLQDVILCIVDYNKDTDRLFFGHDDDARHIFKNNLYILDPDKRSDVLASLPFAPALGEDVLQDYSWLLNDRQCSDCKSAALLPLLRADKITGALFLISNDVNRYKQSHGTEFLQRLSVMTAVAIENCLNQQRIKEIGYQDALTQAYNRRYFDLRIKDEIERSLRLDHDLTCMFVDVDYFKNVNDTYGHHIGDLVLMRIVAMIKEQVRACDIVARYGGEEFVIALPNTNISVASEIANRLRKVISSEKHSFYGKELSITVSIGMTSLQALNNPEINTAEGLSVLLLEYADNALYKAKHNGRNRVVVYSTDLDN
ncbi:MAG: sensor domain-containing diguanylate cyclase [Gammaproteobacteria bacterium]|nr:sensor domain-containing diguanylate cyclase [Gammaproteobacteria bacterium]